MAYLSTFRRKMKCFHTLNSCAQWPATILCMKMFHVCPADTQICHIPSFIQYTFLIPYSLLRCYMPKYQLDTKVSTRHHYHTLEKTDFTHFTEPKLLVLCARHPKKCLIEFETVSKTQTNSQSQKP